MDRTYFLAVLVPGMALLLFPAQAARNVPERQADRPAQQEKSPGVQVDLDRGPDAGMDVDMDGDSDMDVEEPEVEVDADGDDADLDAGSVQGGDERERR